MDKVFAALQTVNRNNEWECKGFNVRMSLKDQKRQQRWEFHLKYLDNWTRSSD